MKLIEHLEHVITLIDNGKPLAEIKSAVLAMHEEVSGYEQAYPKDSQRDSPPSHHQVVVPQDTLPDESEKILILIANATRAITSDHAIRQLGFPAAKGDYFFDQLLKRKFVHTSSGQMGVGWFYHATAAGRDYLAKKGLL